MLDDVLPIGLRMVRADDDAVGVRQHGGRQGYGVARVPAFVLEARHERIVVVYLSAVSDQYLEHFERRGFTPVWDILFVGHAHEQKARVLQRAAAFVESTPYLFADEV